VSIFRNDRWIAFTLSAVAFFVFLGHSVGLTKESGVGGWLLAAAYMAAVVLVIRSIWRDRA